MPYHLEQFPIPLKMNPELIYIPSPHGFEVVIKNPKNRNPPSS